MAIAGPGLNRQCELENSEPCHGFPDPALFTIFPCSSFGLLTYPALSVFLPFGRPAPAPDRTLSELLPTKTHPACAGVEIHLLSICLLVTKSKPPTKLAKNQHPQ